MLRTHNPPSCASQRRPAYPRTLRLGSPRRSYRTFFATGVAKRNELGRDLPPPGRNKRRLRRHYGTGGSKTEGFAPCYWTSAARQVSALQPRSAPSWALKPAVSGGGGGIGRSGFKRLCSW